MEEDDISLLHLKVDSVVFELFIGLDAEVSLVDVSVPIRIGMVVEPSLVRLRKNVQAAVLFVAVFKGSPSGDDSISWSKGEIGQILMEGMSGAGSHSWRLIDEHSVN